MEYDQFKEALARQRSEDSQLLEAKVETKVDRQKQQLDVHDECTMLHDEWLYCTVSVCYSLVLLSLIFVDFVYFSQSVSLP